MFCETFFSPSCLIIFVFALLLVSGCQPSTDSERQRSGAEFFRDITESAGLSNFKHISGAAGKKWFPEIMGAGSGFIDYNGDRWQDILLVNGGHLSSPTQHEPGAVSLYRNNKNGTFTDVSEEAGLTNVSAYGFGLAVADFDNDGDEDFSLTTLHRNLLFQNEAGVFTETGKALNLPEENRWSTAVLFVDVENDGWVDLLIGNYVDWSAETDRWCTVDQINKEYCTPELYTGQSLQLYHNEEGTGLIDVSAVSGIGGNAGKTLGIATFDYNYDGLQDIVVVNDTERDLLYKNLGAGQFEERGLVSGIALSRTGKASGGMGVDTGVIDLSGEPAIFIGNFSREMLSVFQHKQEGRFRDVTTTSGIGRPSILTLTFGLFLFDVDLDADLDLLAVNGHVHEGVTQLHQGVSFAQRPQLFLNDRFGQFDAYVPASRSVFDKELVGRGAAYADIDNDGDLDVLISTNNGPAYLWQNDASSGQSIQITLEGTRSNKSAIGAKVTAVMGERRQVRHVRSGSSYLSASELRLTFGLGERTELDSLLVAWPSGLKDTLTDLSSGKHIVIVEGFPGISQQTGFANKSL